MRCNFTTRTFGTQTDASSASTSTQTDANLASTSTQTDASSASPSTSTKADAKPAGVNILTIEKSYSENFTAP